MSIRFGTSGLRGKEEVLTDRICFLFMASFITYLKQNGFIDKGAKFNIAGDLRPGTERIMKTIYFSCRKSGIECINCGKVPTPALGLYCIKEGNPGAMVTASHNPEGDNGIKLYLPSGEVLKDDEKNIMKIYHDTKESDEFSVLFREDGSLKRETELPEEEPEAKNNYIKRFIDFFPENFLSGKRIVVYQHSTVSRDIISDLLKNSGAEVIDIGRRERFVPVDTESVREEDIDIAKNAVSRYSPFAVVSADGDGDRPLVFDEKGKFISGDILGIMVSDYLGADSISLPVSCNTSMDTLKDKAKITRTRIGSPYVIESMYNALKEGFSKVVSYEANGGFLTATKFISSKGEISPLPTRDALLPILSVLHMCIIKGKRLSEMTDKYRQRYTFSSKIKDFPRKRSERLLKHFSEEKNLDNANSVFEEHIGRINNIDLTDGARFLLDNGDIFHIRPSGNAPELRCYTESSSEENAKKLNMNIIKIIKEI